MAFAALMKSQYALPEGHLKTLKMQPQDELLHISGMGMGTYLGEPDALTDEAVIAALLYTVTHGWNVVDTASNYRWGHGEKSCGVALQALLAGDVQASFKHRVQTRVNVGGSAADPLAAERLAAAAGRSQQKGGDITRDMLFIATKAGFTDPQLTAKLIQAGVMSAADILEGIHSLAPAYIKASLEESLTRLHLEMVDVLYLHNAAEVQLPVLGRDRFLVQLKNAFATCEQLRLEGKLVYYGLATWEALRHTPTHPFYLSLEDVVRVAVEAGGKHHGFRFVQLPINAQMPEAWVEPWQSVAGSNCTLMEAASRLHVAVVGSGPLGEAGLIKDFESRLPHVKSLAECTTVGAKLLQYARSTPGLLCMLVGHKSPEFVKLNLDLTFKEALSSETMLEAQTQLKQGNTGAAT